MRIQTKWHVAVYPELGAGEWAADRGLRAAKALLADVNRHLDHYDAHLKSVAVCGYCGAPWTETDPTYNGGCCDQDEAHHPEAP